jgi:protein involved in polysaccharide export with SLBB domain
VTPDHRAPWQQHLTLGPGDVFDLQVFGHPEMTRTNIVIGPDGRVSFFQIQDFPAAGYTVDELRSRFETELNKYFVAGVRTILTPAVLTSKKYYVLGKVVTEGAFVLDRPVTIVEAVARAKGLQTSSVGATSPEIADLSHSFLARRGQRMPVDFERLFHQGDLSQNIALEPNDYLYFAAATAQEVYVLGEVLTPSRVPIGSQASVLPAISASGGFTRRAYRQRVLVIRGSLQKPEAYAVDTRAILVGRTPDFKLQPHDIIYVNARPWIRVEELLDIAAQSFIESAVTVWSGANVPAVFSSPVLPQL